MSVVFRIDSAGAKELLRSDSVRQDLLQRAERVAQRVRGQARGVLDHGDEGIVADSYTGRGRAGATVIGVPMEEEARSRVLGSSIDAAGG
ncbi:hypothetical protein [Streptomyces sp. bgisy153]|uniref:hypothetical protein n=1 Tax=Streptomyces sp. bgisy153 TaxID=3413793 RepID=UPI003D709E8B